MLKTWFVILLFNKCFFLFVYVLCFFFVLLYITCANIYESVVIFISSPTWTPSYEFYYFILFNYFGVFSPSSFFLTIRQWELFRDNKYCSVIIFFYCIFFSQLNFLSSSYFFYYFSYLLCAFFFCSRFSLLQCIFFLLRDLISLFWG